MNSGWVDVNARSSNQVRESVLIRLHFLYLLVPDVRIGLIGLLWHGTTSSQENCFELLHCHSMRGWSGQPVP